jgi:teichuronic acid biosynthesis glycosyltransferase TuaC
LSTSLPVVVTYRGSDLNPNPSDHPLRQTLGRLLSQLAALRANRIICVSNQLRGRLWWRRSRVNVIPSGVDTKLFFPRPRDTVRAELDWRTDERVVLFNASADPVVKRLDLAQSAIKAAERRCGKIRFVVLDGNVTPEIIPVMMNAADCLLLTSDWEGSPNVVKEAIACNLPVVSVNVGDVEERLAGVECCQIVKRSSEALGMALAEVLPKKTRSNGYQSSMPFELGTVAKRVASVYESVARFGHPG